MIIWSDKKHMLKYIKHIPHSPQKNKNLSRHDRAFVDADNSPYAPRRSTIPIEDYQVSPKAVVNN